jgi:hypothetical protein
VGLTVRDGRATVTLDDGLERIARRAIDEALPGVLELLEREGAAVLEDARAQWPVRSGRSRDGLAVRTVLDLGKGEVVVEIVNAVEYAPWVRPAAWYGSTTAWARLVRDPMRAAHKRAVDQVGRLVVDRLTGVV